MSVIPADLPLTVEQTIEQLRDALRAVLDIDDYRTGLEMIEHVRDEFLTAIAEKTGLRNLGDDWSRLRNHVGQIAAEEIAIRAALRRTDLELARKRGEDIHNQFEVSPQIMTWLTKESERRATPLRYCTYYDAIGTYSPLTRVQTRCRLFDGVEVHHPTPPTRRHVDQRDRLFAVTAWWAVWETTRRGHLAHAPPSGDVQLYLPARHAHPERIRLSELLREKHRLHVVIQAEPVVVDIDFDNNDAFYFDDDDDANHEAWLTIYYEGWRVE